MALRTDYQDFVANAAGKKYRIIDAGDGMVTIQDATTYDQIGDSFSAGVINATNAQVNKNTDQIRSNLIAYSLLDNSDFTQFIAQAGIGGNHGTQAYAGDRWILDSGTVTGEENENGNGYKNITLNGSIRQKVANPPTGEWTAGIRMISGTATVSYADGEFTITSSGGVIEQPILVGGNYDVLPKVLPKGYAAEINECKRYCQVIAIARPVMIIAAGNLIDCSVMLPIGFRISPTIGNIPELYWFRVEGQQFNVTASSIAVQGGSPTNAEMLIRITLNGNPLGSYTNRLGFLSGLNFIASADL